MVPMPKFLFLLNHKEEMLFGLSLCYRMPKTLGSPLSRERGTLKSAANLRNAVRFILLAFIRILLWSMQLGYGDNHHHLHLPH